MIRNERANALVWPVFISVCVFFFHLHKIQRNTHTKTNISFSILHWIRWNELEYWKLQDGNSYNNINSSNDDDDNDDDDIDDDEWVKENDNCWKEARQIAENAKSKRIETESEVLGSGINFTDFCMRNVSIRIDETSTLLPIDYWYFNNSKLRDFSVYLSIDLLLHLLCISHLNARFFF